MKDIDDRVTHLEILLTQQDDVIDTLNRLVHEQRSQLELMQQRVERLEAKQKSGDSNMASEQEEAPPPHY